MELQDLSAPDLGEFLDRRIRLYRGLSDSERDEIVGLVQDLIARRMPSAFVLSSARTAARELAARAEEEAHPADAERQRFIRENALPADQRVTARSQPRREAKVREREEFVANVRRLLREARSARQPHERKKMRRELLGVDLAHLRRALGPEGAELAVQVRAFLVESADVR